MVYTLYLLISSFSIRVDMGFSLITQCSMINNPIVDLTGERCRLRDQRSTIRRKDI